MKSNRVTREIHLTSRGRKMNAKRERARWSEIYNLIREITDVNLIGFESCTRLFQERSVSADTSVPTTVKTQHHYLLLHLRLNNRRKKDARRMY